MALKSTIYKVDLSVVDTDRHYYADHKLTLACHPSEPELRMMIRLCVFALNAHERLEFGKGVSTQDEPDLWQKSLTGEIETWIELGHPDEKHLRSACGKSGLVRVYTYSANPSTWLDPVRPRLEKERKLEVWHLDADECEALGAFIDRSMEIQATLQDGTLWLRDQAGHEASISPRKAW